MDMHGITDLLKGPNPQAVTNLHLGNFISPRDAVKRLFNAIRRQDAEYLFSLLRNSTPAEADTPYTFGSAARLGSLISLRGAESDWAAGGWKPIPGGEVREAENVNAYDLEEPVETRTPLRLACQVGNEHIVRVLLDHGASIYAHVPKDGWTAMHTASLAGQNDVLRLVVKEGPDVLDSYEGFPILLTCCEVIGPRLKGGGRHFLEEVLQYTKDAVDVQSTRPGFQDWTAMHVCALRGKLKSIILLVRAGASLDVRTGEFDMHSRQVNEAAQGVPVARFWIESDDSADPTDPTTTPPDDTAHHRLTRTSRMERGHSPDARRVRARDLRMKDSGLLPIHLACMGGHVRVAAFFIKHGQGPCKPTERFGTTPLHFAVWSGNAKLVAEICRLGGRKSVNTPDRRWDLQSTPLTLAACKGDLDIVQTLLSFGADPTMTVSCNDFPGYEFVTEGDGPWSTEEEEISALHLAIIRGDYHFLRAIIPLLDRKTSADHKLDRFFRPVTPNAAQQKKNMRGPSTDSKASCITARTSSGWQGLSLALSLAATDPTNEVEGVRHVRMFPRHATLPRSAIVDAILEAGGCVSSVENSPVVAHVHLLKLGDESCRRIIDELVRGCTASNMEVELARSCHATLLAAAKLNRPGVVSHLLTQGLADAHCSFITPVSQRPLHVACAFGYGELAQVLINHGADPSEKDESGNEPINKLCDSISRLAANYARIDPDDHDSTHNLPH